MAIDNFGGGASVLWPVPAFGDAEEVEHVLLEGREFGLVGVQDGVLVGDEVPLGEAVEAQDLLGGGPAGGAFFGVEGQLVDAALAHGAPEFALDEGLYQQGEEVDEEQGFDAAFVLEQRRRDLEHAFEVPEALLDGGLALVGVEHVGRREGSIVCE